MADYCRMDIKFDKKRAGVTSIQFIDKGEKTEFLLTPEEFIEYDADDCRWLGHIYGKVKMSEGEYSFSTGLSRIYAEVDSSNSGLKAFYPKVTNGKAVIDGLQIQSDIQTEGNLLDWKITLKNVSQDAVEVTEINIPLLMNQYFRGDNYFKYEKCVMRHTCIVGASSYIYWQKSNGEGPALLMAAVDGTRVETFRREDNPVFQPLDRIPGAFEGVFSICPVGINSALVLEGGEIEVFSFRFALLSSERDINQALAEWNLLSLEALPGIVAPVHEEIKALVCWKGNDLAVRPRNGMDKAAVHTSGKGGFVVDIELGGCGIREIEFFYGGNRSLFSFFGIESVQQIIDEHSAFVAGNHFETDQNDCCYHAFLMWDMVHKRRINSSFNPYHENWWAGGSDDTGLVSGLFLSEKNVYRPVKDELQKLNAYVRDFIIGRLTEHPGYKVHRMVPWYTMFEPWAGNGADDAWRAYNYVHVINIVFNMYRIQKIYEFPFLDNCREYLKLSYQYAKAMFHYWMFPDGVGATEYGNMGEMTLPLYLDKALEEEGFIEEAKELAVFFDRKAAFFSSASYPFGSEMAFDTTAYEAVYAYGKRIDDEILMERSAKASLGNRGKQPVWYLYYTDVRGGGDSNWNISYMTQLGIWPVWDWAVRTGKGGMEWALDYYRAYLSGWQIYNSDGCWSDSEENRGATGWIAEGYAGIRNGQITEGGFPFLKGIVALSGEAELGYFGALRSACSILAEHPVVGILGLGCDWQMKNRKMIISPKDGLQMRFYDLLNRWSVEINRDFIEQITIKKGAVLTVDVVIHNYTEDIHTTILSVMDMRKKEKKEYHILITNNKETFSIKMEAL